MPDIEWLHGFHAVMAALQQQQVEHIWLDQNRRDGRSRQLVQAARDARVKLQKVPRARLDALAGDGVPHQGVLARVRNLPLQGDDAFEAFLEALNTPAFLLVLDGVLDPHNLGACLRTAEASGVQAVIVPRNRTAPLTGVARKAASGAAERLPVFQVSNLARALGILKEKGVWLVGAAAGMATTLYEADFRGPLALVMGGEGAGLRRLTRDECDSLVAIPMAPGVESLNVSVAAGIMLYEARRQRAMDTQDQKTPGHDSHSA